jgi:hypothetical protein
LLENTDLTQKKSPLRALEVESYTPNLCIELCITVYEQIKNCEKIFIKWIYIIRQQEFPIR